MGYALDEAASIMQGSHGTAIYRVQLEVRAHSVVTGKEVSILMTF